jgi:hypothetical protein
MKTLLLSVAIALVGIIAAFLALSLAGLEKSVAGPIATAIVGGIPYIRESLDKEPLSGKRRTGRTVLSFEGFGLAPGRLILYGTLIVFAAMNLSSALGGIMASGSKLSFETGGVAIIKTLGIAVVYPAMFLVGRWVGRRSKSKGIAAIFLISIFARVSVSLIDVAMITPERRITLIGMPIWQQILFGVVVFFLIGCWGYWRGRRQRLAAYLTYLLRRVPIATREAIVELAFAESTREEAHLREVNRPDTTPRAPFRAIADGTA